MAEKSLLIRIRGRVQGVGYRAWACAEARDRGVRGWIRNEPDGTVTAMVAGLVEDVDGLLQRLRTGPRGASVTEILFDDPAGETPGGDFRILR